MYYFLEDGHLKLQVVDDGLGNISTRFVGPHATPPGDRVPLQTTSSNPTDRQTDSMPFMTPTRLYQWKRGQPDYYKEMTAGMLTGVMRLKPSTVKFSA